MKFSFHDMALASVETAALRLAIEIVRQALGQILEAMDDRLAANRDKGRYEIKEFQEREIDTVVGTLRFRRRVGKLKSRVRARAWSRKGLYALSNVLFKVLEGSLGPYIGKVATGLDERLQVLVKAGAKAVKGRRAGRQPRGKKRPLPLHRPGNPGVRGHSPAAS